MNCNCPVLMLRAWTNVSVCFLVRHFLIWHKLRMRKKATLQIFWTWWSWLITLLKIAPMSLADSVETTLTSAILMSLIGGRGRCLACITKNWVLSRLSLSLLHAIPLTQASIFNRAADSSLGLGLNDINLAIVCMQVEPIAMFSNYVTKGGRVYGVKIILDPVLILGRGQVL